MQLLQEIFCQENLNLHGKTIERQAVRAVIGRQQTLLLVYSTVNKDYKFPGGGVEAGEEFETALAREVAEECGVALTRILQPLGKIIEYDHPLETGIDLFKMTSYYYLCEAAHGVNPQRLDAYEQELGFQPHWVSLQEAIANNTALLKSGSPTPRWTRRDTYLMNYLHNMGILK
jgi:8-oxo-dGTP pyrophosphatase MutT (NUDIX family)